jgi:hypothetical protein
VGQRVHQRKLSVPYPERSPLLDSKLTFEPPPTREQCHTFILLLVPVSKCCRPSGHSIALSVPTEATPTSSLLTGAMLSSSLLTVLERPDHAASVTPQRRRRWLSAALTLLRHLTAHLPDTALVAGHHVRLSSMPRQPSSDLVPVLCKHPSPIILDCKNITWKNRAL